MPIWKFRLRTERLQKQREAEIQGKHEELVFELYVHSRSVSTSLFLNNDPPLTPAQQKKKPKSSDVVKIEKMQKEHERLGREWQEALRSVKHFGNYIGLGNVFGVPEDQQGSIEDRKEDAKKQAQDRRQRLIENLRGFAEQHGNVVLFEDKNARDSRRSSLEPVKPSAVTPLVVPIDGVDEMSLRARVEGAAKDFEDNGSTDEAKANACKRWAVVREALDTYLEHPPRSKDELN